MVNVCEHKWHVGMIFPSELRGRFSVDKVGQTLRGFLCGASRPDAATCALKDDNTGHFEFVSV